MRRAPGRGPPSSRGPPPGMYGGGGGYYGAGGGGGQGSGNHGAGGVQAAFSNRNQRGEHRPLDVTAGLLAHLDRRLMDSTALGPNARARHSLSPPQSHPAWRRHYTTPRYTLFLHIENSPLTRKYYEVCQNEIFPSLLYTRSNSSSNATYPDSIAKSSNTGGLTLLPKPFLHAFTGTTQGATLRRRCAPRTSRARGARSALKCARWGGHSRGAA